jgi:hypothetical protein
MEICTTKDETAKTAYSPIESLLIDLDEGNDEGNDEDINEEDINEPSALVIAFYELAQLLAPGTCSG